MRVRFQPKSRFRQLILPSLPVRHRTSSWNAGSLSTVLRRALGLPCGREHHVAHAELAERFPHGTLAVASVCADRDRDLLGTARHALDGRHEHRRVRRVTDDDAVVEHHAVDVVDDLRLYCRASRNAALSPQVGSDPCSGRCLAA